MVNNLLGLLYTITEEDSRAVRDAAKLSDSLPPTVL